MNDDNKELGLNNDTKAWFETCKALDEITNISTKLHELTYAIASNHLMMTSALIKECHHLLNVIDNRVITIREYANE